MGRVYERIDEHQAAWIAQPVDVLRRHGARRATTATSTSRPKGPIGSLRVLDDHTVAYLDIVGSGAETIAHLRDNGRICVMFCAFEGRRGSCACTARASTCARATPGSTSCWRSASTSPRRRRRGARSSVVHVTRIADSCGYGVPLMSYEGERPHMDLSTAKRLRVEGPDAMRDYEQAHNRESIDGLPALS